MSYKLRKIGMMLAASLGLWLGVVFVSVVASSDMTDFAAMMAFLATGALWLIWGLSMIDDKSSSETQEKAKRQPGEDARLALLLQLMDEDERQTLKQRLADELSADGEAISLAELLAAGRDHRDAR